MTQPAYKVHKIADAPFGIRRSLRSSFLIMKMSTDKRVSTLVDTGLGTTCSVSTPNATGTLSMNSAVEIPHGARSIDLVHIRRKTCIELYIEPLSRFSKPLLESSDIPRYIGAPFSLRCNVPLIQGIAEDRMLLTISRILCV